MHPLNKGHTYVCKGDRNRGRKAFKCIITSNNCRSFRDVHYHIVQILLLGKRPYSLQILQSVFSVESTIKLPLKIKIGFRCKKLKT